MTPRRRLFALAITSAVPLLVACPKKEVPVADAAPPPVVVEDAAPIMLVPEELDAGQDADADAGKKYTGRGTNTNVARLQQCCSALAKNAAGLGPSPEQGVVLQAAAQCKILAASVGPSGTAPETGVIRSLLAGKTLPAACAGF